MNEHHLNLIASKRIIAFLLDLLIYVALWIFFYFNFHLGDYFSWLLASAYLLVKDGLVHGQSLGKLILKLQVVDSKEKQPISLMTSIERNAIFVLPNVFRFIPFLGTLLLILIFAMESYLIFTHTTGIRWGDQFAKTEVIQI